MQIILFDAGPLATSLAALAAGLCTALAVVLLARRGATAGGYRLVLVGIGVGASLSGLNSLLLVTGNLDQAMYAQLWLAGSLNTRTWSHVVPAALGLLASVPLALYHGRRLEVLELGDASAAQLGVAVERVRLQMVMVAVGMTAIATAAAGPIAFIALAGPAHLARRLTRSAGVPLLSGALMGAVPAGRRPARPAPGIRRQPADRPDDRPARRFLPALCYCCAAADLKPRPQRPPRLPPPIDAITWPVTSRSASLSRNSISAPLRPAARARFAWGWSRESAVPPRRRPGGSGGTARSRSARAPPR